MRGKILTVESEYGRRSHKENGEELLWNLAALPRELAGPPPLPCVGLDNIPCDNIPPATQRNAFSGA